MQIMAIAYLAAVFMFILLLWMIRDLFLPKKQEFYEAEKECLALLKHELEYMENAIRQHVELAEKANGNADGTELEKVREIYSDLKAALVEIKYDKNVFIDKGITWPGQRCYDVYLYLSQNHALGFDAGLVMQSQDQDNVKSAGVATYEKLTIMAQKFYNNKAKVLKRLQIYK